ncbi:hypothetical protein MBANPS3_009973 [Mucor bainieri]
MDILTLLASVLIGIAAVQTATLFVYHKLRGPFKELGILQKDIQMLRKKIQERNKTAVRRVAQKYYKRKTSAPKSQSGSGRNSPLRYQKDMAKTEDIKEESTPLNHGSSDVAACSSTNSDSNASTEVKIQDLERAYYDLDAKFNRFKKKTTSNQLRIKDYAKAIKKYAESLQADQDEFRQDVGSIFSKLDDDMNFLEDGMDVRLCNVEDRVCDLIDIKLEADKRKRQCRNSARVI